jgi:hypothetical protein
MPPAFAKSIDIISSAEFVILFLFSFVAVWLRGDQFNATQQKSPLAMCASAGLS